MRRGPSSALIVSAFAVSTISAAPAVANPHHGNHTASIPSLNSCRGVPANEAEFTCNFTGDGRIHSILIVGKIWANSNANCDKCASLKITGAVFRKARTGDHQVTFQDYTLSFGPRWHPGTSKQIDYKISDPAVPRTLFAKGVRYQLHVDATRQSKATIVSLRAVWGDV